jgi:hypothetical protein
LELDAIVCSRDSTTVDLCLCLCMFDWEIEYAVDVADPRSAEQRTAFAVNRQQRLAQPRV